MKADAVFEGGGIKGLAFLGAVEVMEEHGYEWEQLAGTSAGAIIAALLAVGVSGKKELTSLLLKFPFDKLEKKKGVVRVPVLGPWFCLERYNGIYPTHILEEWLKSIFRKKGILTFGDLPKNKLKIIVTDITNCKMCVIPDDLPSYGLDPSQFPLARAVCMSCSIPYIFRPHLLAGNLMVDGGVLSNYPIWLFDSTEAPRWPTFGFRLSGPQVIESPRKVKGLVGLSVALIRTMVEGHDRRYIESNDAARTIFIKNIPYTATHFSLTETQKLELVNLGKTSTLEFLAKWNFQKYIEVHRIKSNPKILV